MQKKTKKSERLLKNREGIYSVAAILLIFDQLIKLLVRSKVSLMEEISVIPGFFSIYHLENTGGAFSIFSGATIVLIVLSVLVLAFIHCYVITDEKMTKWRIFGLGIVIGGIVGNLVDRLLYGAVVDYLSFNIFGYEFPVFNLADVGITIGFLILAINILRRDVNEFRDKSRDGRGEEN